MTDTKFRFWLWFIRGVGVIVPRRLRAGWRQEWEAELQYRELLLADWDKLDLRHKLDLTRRSLGAFWDALLLQPRRLEDEMFQDIRFGARMLIKQPVFTLIAVLTLALGIGANLTIFGFVDAFFLRPISAREPDRLLTVEASPNGRWNNGSYYSYPAYVHFRDHCGSFESLAAHYSTAPLNLVIDGDARVANGSVVSANYFPLLGIQPSLGRFFLPEEDAVPDRNPVVVISYRMWQDRFNGDPAVIGKQLSMNGRDCEIVGVAPADFTGVLAGFQSEFWLPTMMLHLGYRFCDVLNESDCTVLQLLGRLAPGVTAAEAEAEMNVLAEQLAEAFPAEQGRVISLRPAAGVRMIERVGFAYQMQLLMTVTGLLLVIACSNVAGLLLVRAAARRKEIAIRLCIGAGRGRLIRQFLTEALLLAAMGGSLGLLISRWAKGILSVFYNTSSGTHYDLSLSSRALIYALAVTLFSAFLFGVLPAIQSTRQDLVRGLKESGSSQGPRQHRSRSTLVVAQMALSFVLLVAAGLLVRSSSHVRQGANFDPLHVAALRLRPGLLKYPADKAQAFTREVVRRLEATAGVQSVSLGSGIGYAWRSTGNLRVRLPEQIADRAEDQRTVEYQEVAPHFFRTLKIPLLQGREFNERDVPGAPRVAIINETLARSLWPDGDLLTKTLMLNDQAYQLIGVSKDARSLSALDDSFPFIYLPYWQSNIKAQVDARLIIRVSGDPRAMLPTLRSVITAVDPQVPLSEEMSLAEQVNLEYRSVLLTSSVLTWAGALAFLMSMIGLYGVLAFAVGERRREMGIRMALGAKAGDVVRLVIAHGLRLAITGIGFGLPAAYLSTRMIKALLYGVSATDPPTFVVIALVIATVALLACWLPARRATKVDPMIALRCD
jgi:putative ABC transport system permease protein